LAASRFATRAARPGVTRADGKPISANDPGREVSDLIASEGPLAAAAKAVVREMGENVAQLLLECKHHLPRIEHILVRGGLVGDHAVGDLLRSVMAANLPSAVAAKIVDEAPSQYSGAFAAAWLATHGWRA
jgi:hypothetical protein